MTTSEPRDRAAAASVDADRARATREAAAWFVLLSEEPDDRALQAKIEAWCGESTLNREVWQRTQRAWDMYGKTSPMHREQWQSRATRPSRAAPASPARTARVGRRHRRIAGAAALALAACIAWFAAPVLLLRLQADVTTSTAEVRTLQLEDGTLVRLAPESAIGIRYTERERHARLLRGQAFFEVKPNADRPFRVVAGDVTTTVLGTAFDVRLEADGASVAVREGLVRVEDGRVSPPRSQEVAAGAWVHVTAGHPARGTIAPDEVAAWADGRLVARNLPITEIVDELRRHQPGLIVMQDQAFGAQRVNGVFDLSRPAATLRDLAAAHGAVVHELSPWLLLVTAR